MGCRLRNATAWRGKPLLRKTAGRLTASGCLLLVGGARLCRADESILGVDSTLNAQRPTSNGRQTRLEV